jgi:hypothetical protein
VRGIASSQISGIGKAKPYRTGERPSRILKRLRVRSSKIRICVITVVGFATLLPASLDTFGQKRTNSSRATARRPVAVEPVTETVDPKKLERAMGVICAERAMDSVGSLPIDEMQARESLELNHPKAIVGAQRARRLLPVAKELVIEALNQLAVENKIGLKGVRAASMRVRAVTEVVPDPDLRDNAAVIMNDPHTIRFGTIFLVGLPSDEGMMSVLAHELTHIADGRQNSLQPLFRLIGKRAERITGLRINGQKPEELSCDLVGVRATQFLISRTTSNEPLTRRLARSLEHNCVDDDETDEEHLSPRSTMRAVLALDSVLTRDLAER